MSRTRQPHGTPQTAIHASADVLADIARAITILHEGGVAVLPTDTLYGLTAAVAHPAAIERIFEIKGREATKQLPIFVADVAAARALARNWSPLAEALALAFWPGALTIVVEAADNVPSSLTRGGATIGLRCADHRVSHTVVSGCGPLAVTSANRSGEPPAMSAIDALRALGDDVDLVLDDGPSPGAMASTVVRIHDATTDAGDGEAGGSWLEVLREGAITNAALQQVVDALAQTASAPHSPRR